MSFRVQTPAIDKVGDVVRWFDPPPNGAVRAGIGAALRTDHSRIVNEPLPEEMIELLKKLDHPTNDSRETEDA